MKAYTFDEGKTAAQCAQWIRNWFKINGGSKPTAVVGISGGKDSAVVASLCCVALGKENVIGVLMPNGEQKDIDDSWKVINALDITNVIYANIKSTVNALQNSIEEFYTLKEGADPGPWVDTRTNLPLGHISEKTKMETMKWSEAAKINTPARIRMTTLYAVAANYGGRVLNTCNRSEDAVGYATLFGDSAGDLAPICKLTVTEIQQLAKQLGFPDELAYKTPSDGLCGKTDEENLGITYKEIDEYLREGKNEDTIGKKVIEMWKTRGWFKLALINLPCYDPHLPDSLHEWVLRQPGRTK